MIRLLLFTAVYFCSIAYAAEVTFLTKPVEVKHKGKKQWERLDLHQEVVESDRVRTGMGGRVEITIEKGRVIRIDQATEIEVSQLITDKKSFRTRVNVVFGRFWGSLTKRLKPKRGEQFEVRSPTSIIGVKGTRFGVDVDKDTKEIQVSVVDGKIEAKPPPTEEQAPTEIQGPQEIAPPQEVSLAEWTIIVSSMQKIVIAPEGKPVLSPLTPQDLSDEWIEFNNQRDGVR